MVSTARLPVCLPISPGASYAQQRINPGVYIATSHYTSILTYTNSFFGGSAGPSKSTKFLNEVFDSYRGKSSRNQNAFNPINHLSNPDDAEETPDGIGIDGAMRFLGDIEVQLDEVACLAVFEMCKCPSMGEFTREGFVDGWKLTQ